MTNYIRGRITEYRYCRRLEKEGWKIVQRSAGSKSPVDVWAVKEDEILLVQLKRSKTRSFSFKKELREFADLQVPISCTKRFVVYVDRIGFITIYEK